MAEESKEGKRSRSEGVREVEVWAKVGMPDSGSEARIEAQAAAEDASQRDALDAERGIVGEMCFVVRSHSWARFCCW